MLGVKLLKKNAQKNLYVQIFMEEIFVNTILIDGLKKLKKMNNRKQTNARGKNPRTMYSQTIIESATVKRIENDEEIIIPNPRFGQTRVIHHKMPVKI